MNKLSEIIPLSKFKDYVFLLKEEDLYEVLLEHLRINKSDIDKHYESNSAILAFWSAKYEFQKFKLARMQRTFERFHARRYMEVKASMESRTTETQIKQKLLDDAELNKKQDMVDILVFKVGLLKSIVDVMHDRNQNVISLGASARREMHTYDSTKADTRNRLRSVIKGR